MWKQKSAFAMKLYLQSLKQPKKLIAFDVGSSFTGVAISSSDLKNSYYLKVINGSVTSQKFLKTVMRCFKQQQNLSGILIGQTYDKQSRNKISEKAIKQFTNQLNKKKLKIPYCYIDQYNTTKQAKQKLISIEQAFGYWGHLHSQKQLLDGLAAINILNRFLVYYNKN